LIPVSAPQQADDAAVAFGEFDDAVALGVVDPWRLKVVWIHFGDGDVKVMKAGTAVGEFGADGEGISRIGDQGGAAVELGHDEVLAGARFDVGAFANGPITGATVFVGKPARRIQVAQAESAGSFAPSADRFVDDAMNALLAGFVLKDVAFLKEYQHGAPRRGENHKGGARAGDASVLDKCLPWGRF